MNGNGSDIAAILSSLAGVCTGTFAYVSSRRANARAARLEKGRLELEKDRGTWERYEALIDQLQEEVGRLRTALISREGQLTTLGDTVMQMQHEMQTLRDENRSLLDTIEELQFTIGRLQRT